MNKQKRDWNVLSMLEWGTDYFKEREIPDPRHSMELLLSEVLDIKRLDLYLQYDRPLSPDELDRLRPLIKRRASHEPLQHITGYTDFMNARISVSPDVLIPRIETEQLVEIILQREEEENLAVLDIGTGSGCIPIALKMERPSWSVTGLEHSESALEIARSNAGENKAEIRFVKGDLFDWENLVLGGPYDVIVSNPPYVLPEEKEHLARQVREYEPEEALFCEDLPGMYRAIRNCSSELLAEGGRLYLEIHEKHPEQIMELFPGEAWKTELVKDYQKKPRFIRGRLIA